MNNKKKSSCGPLLVIVIIIVVAYLGIRSSLGGSAGLNEYYSLLNQEGDTSYALIDEAEAAGTIDHETAIKYKMLAMFKDESLPTEYQSELVDYRVGSTLFKEVRAEYDSLSAETQATLDPFFKRPDDAGSYWNLQYQAGAYDEADEQASLIQTALAARPNATLYTDFILTADDEVKIWYPNDSIIVPNPSGGLGVIIMSSNSAKGVAEKIKTVLDRDQIISTYNNYFGKTLLSDAPRGGDERLDLYVAPTGTDLGWTIGEYTPPPTTSYMIINPALGANEKILRTTLAHEIFHVYQFLFKQDLQKDEWWNEATATWSEDFMYPTDNTEQGYLKPFIEHPEVPLNIEKPPENHMYGAYIFAYFIANQSGDNIIRDSWYGCENELCLDALDGLIDGGFKKQWKEFTLWNYNKAPVDYYFDYPSFPTQSSENGPNTMEHFLSSEEYTIDLDSLKLLTSEIDIAHNNVTDEKIKKLVFTDLTNFTGKSDKAGLKAIIYYKDGRKEVEDWTEKTKRSFCIDSSEENFEKVVLITSNADKENSIGSTEIKVEGKPSCYEIDQADTRQAGVVFNYVDGGVPKVININSTINISSNGEPSKPAPEGEEYAYQAPWELNYVFTQVKDSFTAECDNQPVLFSAGWTTRDAGIMSFDLSSESLGEGDTFSVDLTYGLPHPEGNFETGPAASFTCINTSVPSGTISTAGYSATVEGLYQGKILEMNEAGAKIQIQNACYYDSCTLYTGAPFQTMESPITLEIKKKGN